MILVLVHVLPLKRPLGYTFDWGLSGEPENLRKVIDNEISSKSELFDSLFKTNGKILISESLYLEFLNMKLPVKYTESSFFFREGEQSEEIEFNKEGDYHYCILNEKFFFISGLIVHIRRMKNQKHKHKPFVILNIQNLTNVKKDFDQMIGNSYETVNKAIYLL
mgnify:CR=1 FL=1